MTERFSPTVKDTLLRAGWSVGRSAYMPMYAEFEPELFPAAREVLIEFGGLYFGACGPGKDCATSDVRIDPSLAVHLKEDLLQHEQALGVRLFAIGDAHRSHLHLIISDAGSIYILNDELLFLASTFDIALEKLILGLD